MKLSQLIPKKKPYALVMSMVFVLLSGAWGSTKFKVLHRFYAGKNNNGGLYASLTLDAKGNLYGTTWGGGVYANGTLFELVPTVGGSWRIKVLHSFDPSTDGDSPSGALFVKGDATLYGTTSAGGEHGGTVFQMTRTSGSWTFEVIDSYGSRGGVVLDQTGNLYGNVGPGEYDYNGAVTELVDSSGVWTQSYLYSFCAKPGCPDGSIPVSGVIFDGAENLYGTTEYGGMGQLGGLGGGTAYELKHKSDGTWEHLVLHNFPAFNGDGFRLLAGLVLDKSGNLYGATIQGGSAGCGMVFKLTHGANGWKESVVHDFIQPTSGCGPSGVTFDQAGNLYGTAGGGTGQCEAGCGVVFKLTHNSGSKWNYSVLHHFTGNDGAYPDAGVILDPKGNLYGTTELGGGGHSVGVVFEITP
ncbi:MAG TPA: choice-of-anchor tandem repeat GloVer-containing protein [Terriglobales bacterium]|jgi:uncharacterized repeat protein (TIGR03803 family)|nr:choice-of-anchor tandem repeat GloVer-containing protein [Terriglobales bacterium]